MVGQHDRLLGQRAHLVVEHELAACALAPGVVDTGHARGVGPLAHEQAVVADRRADDGEHAGVDELVEVATDVVGGAAREAGGLSWYELDGAVELDLVQSLAHGLFEAGPAVVLGEVVEDPEQQWGGTHRRQTIISACTSRGSWPNEQSASATALPSSSTAVASSRTGPGTSGPTP